MDARAKTHYAAYRLVRRWDPLCLLEERKFPGLHTCVVKNTLHIFSSDPDIVDLEKDSRLYGRSS